MGAETGVTTSLFPSDKVTLEFLRAQKRENDWQNLEADSGSEYDETIEINLSEVVPMVAQPHSPGNVCPVSAIAGKKVDQVAIGSCTNASLWDLSVVGSILKGKKINSETSVIVAPGSKQVFSMISKNGVLSSIIDAGARIMESTCGFCIGNGQAPKTNAVSVRTNNRNFEGRSGTKTAGIYLVSPETAALCALKGEFVDPLTMKEKDFPKISMPKKFDIDDSMIIEPKNGTENIEVFRGPNIGDPPHKQPLKQRMSGHVAIKVGDKITTDHIMPAGARLKYRSNIKKYSEFVFEGVDPNFYKNASELRDAGKDVFIVAGESYGQGSSREHAALCPMFLGVKAVIAKSFERIHSANLINFGILPLIFKDPSNYDKIEKGDKLVIEDVISKLTAGENLLLKNCMS